MAFAFKRSASNTLIFENLVFGNLVFKNLVSKKLAFKKNSSSQGIVSIKK